MKAATIPIPEIGAIAATRGMLGAGVALLISERIPADKRKRIGWSLALAGALSTIPLLMDIARKSHELETAEITDESPE